MNISRTIYSRQTMRLGSPPIFILDEAASSVDTGIEAEINKNPTPEEYIGYL